MAIENQQIMRHKIIIAAKIRRVLNVWVPSCRSAQVPLSHNLFPEELLVKDPLPVSILLLIFPLSSCSCCINIANVR